MTNSATVALTNHFLLEILTQFLSQPKCMLLTDLLTDRMNDDQMNEGPQIHATFECILSTNGHF